MRLSKQWGFLAPPEGADGGSLISFMAAFSAQVSGVLRGGGLGRHLCVMLCGGSWLPLMKCISPLVSIPMLSIEKLVSAQSL